MTASAACAATSIRRAAAIAALAVGAAITAWGLPAQAVQGNGMIGVDISLQSGAAAPSTGSCRRSNVSGGLGARLTVVCSTEDAVINRSSEASGVTSVTTDDGGAFGYLMQIRRGDVLLGAVDSYIGIGTVTSWRVIHLANWDYVELTVGW